jgi:hypothetical protein
MDRGSSTRGHRDVARGIVSRSGKDRGTECFQKRVKRQVAIEWPKLLGGVGPDSNGVGSSPLIERDLSSQVRQLSGSARHWTSPGVDPGLPRAATGGPTAVGYQPLMARLSVTAFLL